MSEFQRDIKNGAKYNPAMQITDKDEAGAYFMKCVRHCILFGRTLEAAKHIERQNIGYWSGYFDEEVRVRIQGLFETTHPVREGEGPRPADDIARREKKAQNLGELVDRQRSNAMHEQEAPPSETEAAVRRLSYEMPVQGPQLVEKLFELREKQLYCRFCGSRIEVSVTLRGGNIMSSTLHFCDCAPSVGGRLTLTENTEAKQ